VKKLNVLVACESSGTVREAFRKLGHNAWSADLLPADDGSRYHYQGDVLKVLSATRLIGGIAGMQLPKKWDLLIAHPPCTYLANSGVSWLYKWILSVSGHRHRRDAVSSPQRGAVEAVEGGAWFFAQLYYHASKSIDRVCVENPIMHCHGADLIGALACGGQRLRPTQIIQPYMFGHLESKATGLYLRGLPKLVRRCRMWPRRSGR
jgi:hypothetical protein